MSHLSLRTAPPTDLPPARRPARAVEERRSQPRVLGGRYEIGEVMGRRGMANVHQGRDLRSGRLVAIKVLRKDLAQDPLFRSRFRREARTLAGLDHPTIVALRDTGYEEVESGSTGLLRVPFIVLEHVAGRSLQDLLRSGRPLPHRESIDYQLGVLSALAFSHRAGIIHRDIKPGNVMITPEGVVKVLDFGIARTHGDPTATMTQAQAFLGTPTYVSPEQVRGETADVRSDLYSAGCLLYELLTGRPPFVGDDPFFVAYQHVHEAPAPVSTYGSDLTPALDPILAQALAKAPKDRFQSARQFTRALRSAMSGNTDDKAYPGHEERCA